MEWEDVKQKLMQEGAVDAAIERVKGAFYADASRLEVYGLSQTIQALEKMRDGDDRDLSDAEKGMVSVFMDDAFQQTADMRKAYFDIQDTELLKQLGGTREANRAIRDAFNIPEQAVSQEVDIYLQEKQIQLQEKALLNPNDVSEYERILISAMERKEALLPLSQEENTVLNGLSAGKEGAVIKEIVGTALYREFDKMADEYIKADLFEKVEAMELTTEDFVGVLDEVRVGKRKNIENTITELEDMIDYYDYRIKSAYEEGGESAIDVDDIRARDVYKEIYLPDAARSLERYDKREKKTQQNISLATGGDGERLITTAILEKANLTEEQVDTLIAVVPTDDQLEEYYSTKVTAQDILDLTKRDDLALSDEGQKLLKYAQETPPMFRNRLAGMENGLVDVEYLGIDANQWQAMKESIQQRDDAAEIAKYGDVLSKSLESAQHVKDNAPQGEDLEKGGRQK